MHAVNGFCLSVLGVCPIGQYFDMGMDSCQLCPVGYYQNLTGQFLCQPCGAGFTTEFNGTTDASRCTGIKTFTFNPE